MPSDDRYRDGDRVKHMQDGTEGTVRAVYDSAGAAALPHLSNDRRPVFEVRWDGTAYADDLESVADQLEMLHTRRDDMTDDRTDFVLLPVDGPPRSGRREPGETINQAIRRHVPDYGTAPAGRLRLWFRDRFGPDLPPNPLADAVIARLGYRHPTGWYGLVAVSMEEDATGDVPPLLPEVRAAIDELVAETGR